MLRASEILPGCHKPTHAPVRAVGPATLRRRPILEIAATFVDVHHCAQAYALVDPRHYFAQLPGYRAMSGETSLTLEPVQFLPPARQIVSRPGVRVNCADCGEEIINEWETVIDGQPFCVTCAHGGWFLFLVP